MLGMFLLSTRPHFFSLEKQQQSQKIEMLARTER